MSDQESGNTPRDSGRDSDDSGRGLAPDGAPDRSGVHTGGPESRPSSGGDRTWKGVPRGAVAVVIVGLIASLGVYVIGLRTGGSSAEQDWETIEPVTVPAAKEVGDGGSFGLARTSISALPPNASSDLIFRIAGVVQIDSGKGADPASVRCDITSTTPGDTFIARTTSKRSAWPRPSDELQAQEVPELSVAKLPYKGADVQELPIRDVFRRYTDSTAPTLVDWDFLDETTQTWIWTMAKGTGGETATMGYDVIFRTQERPEATIDCGARVADSETRVRVRAEQQEWPLADAATVEEGADASNVQ